MTIIASRCAELAELLVQWRFVQFPDGIHDVDVLERRFLSFPCVGKHDPLEIFRDRSTNVRTIYFRDCGLGDELLERCFRFKHPNSLFSVTQSARRDINENEWTETEDLFDGNIDSSGCVARSGIVCS